MIHPRFPTLDYHGRPIMAVSSRETLLKSELTYHSNDTMHGFSGGFMRKGQWCIYDFIKGATFSLATSAYTKGAKLCFPIFFLWQNFLFPKGPCPKGAMAQCPLNMPLGGVSHPTFYEK